MEKTLGIYVHIPFCLKKCRYCDFVSFSVEKGLSAKADEYAYRVCEEIESTDEDIKRGYTVDSIFFGGGTPTCLGVDMIGRILLCIKKNFNVPPDAEITIEANPETVNVTRASVLRSLGFNRVSMGVQSLDDEVLNRLGRVHNAAKAVEAFNFLRGSGFKNINLDLMFGVPGQSFESWKDTLEKVIRLRPEHISFYSLQIEEGTPFYEEYKEGSLSIPSWEENRKMYSYALKVLEESGYIHYEISNAAKMGFECRHNLKYWTMNEYLGFGTAAHSFISGKRFFNTDDLDYEREYEEEDPETIAQDRMGDFVFTELRLIKGIDIKGFEQSFGKDFEDVFSAVLDSQDIVPFIDVKRDEDGKLSGLSLSRRGLDNTNMVMQRFLEALYEIKEV